MDTLRSRIYHRPIRVVVLEDKWGTREIVRVGSVEQPISVIFGNAVKLSRARIWLQNRK